MDVNLAGNQVKEERMVKTAEAGGEVVVVGAEEVEEQGGAESRLVDVVAVAVAVAVVVVEEQLRVQKMVNVHQGKSVNLVRGGVGASRSAEEVEVNEVVVNLVRAASEAEKAREEVGRGTMPRVGV